MSAAEVGAWAAWYHAAEDAYALALDRQADAVWSGLHVSGDFADAALEVTRTRKRWEERLTAYNAFMDAEPRRRAAQ